jgi:hypothetical protein
MRAYRFHFIFSASLMICLSGCVSVSDISHDARYRTDYIAGAVYRLKQPLFADKADLSIFGTYSGLTLCRFGDFGMPRTIQDYARAPQDWKSIAGVAQPGTLIRIVRVQLVDHPENGWEVFVQGKLLDIAWAKKDAELAFVSRDVLQDPPYIHMPFVDTNILELVTKP